MIGLSTRTFGKNVGTRAFHHFKSHSDLYWSQPGLGKVLEPNDFFTKNGGHLSKNLVRLYADGTDSKMTSLPPPPPIALKPLDLPLNTTQKSANILHKRIRIGHNRSPRTVVKPVRVPIVIDIRQLTQEMKPKLPPPILVPAPAPQTLSRRFVNLSKEAGFLFLGIAKQKGMEQLKKVEMPKLDAQKVKKLATYGGPVVTSIGGYLYGRFKSD